MQITNGHIDQFTIMHSSRDDECGKLSRLTGDYAAGRRLLLTVFGDFAMVLAQ